jgi:trehalose 6-phosphate phosphatase
VRLWSNADMAESGTEARPPLLQADAALYLDFDGTLATFAPHPDGVTVHDSLPALLAGLRERLSGAVALVTGRSLAALDLLTGFSSYAAAGLHGHEWRLASGHPVSAENPVGARRIVQALRERFGNDDRLVIEDKGAAVALHFRRAPERAEECIAVMREFASAEFEVLLGHQVVEARPRGADKGAALRALAGHPPFRGRRPAFVGDDVTDEDGFRAAADLGGYGVKVGVGPTAARYRMATVEDVHAWLAASLAALGQEAAP